MVDYFGEVARMEFEGEITILADATRVWQLTSDPEVLMSCIPGAKEINQISASEYEGTIERGVGGVLITLVGGAEIVELDPPNRILARASGEDPKTKSRMTATAELELVDGAGSTTLQYAIEMSFTGRLVSLGSRIVKRQVDSDIGTFFDNLTAHAENDL